MDFLRRLLSETPPSGIDEDKIVDIKYRVNGDKSHTARIEFESGRVNAHTNKNITTLRKLVNDRYKSGTFYKAQ